MKTGQKGEGEGKKKGRVGSGESVFGVLSIQKSSLDRKQKRGDQKRGVKRILIGGMSNFSDYSEKIRETGEGGNP